MSGRIEAVAAEDNARQNGHAGNMCESRSAWPQRRAFEQRLRTVTNPTFGKKTDHASFFQPLDCSPDGFAIRTISIYRERIDSMQKKTQDRRLKKFCHRHPVDFAPNH